MEELSRSEIRTTGITVVEIAEKTGKSVNAVRLRLQKRAIKPIGYIGMVAYYTSDAVDKVKEFLPSGKASPKWGKNRQATEEEV